MALFGFGKKKDEEKNIPACACQSDCATFEATEEDANKVKIEDGARKDITSMFWKKF